ncbi:ThiF family adenylyltransferase [Acinetobacter baumannii]|uniref:ThiF family adenylyltransferase n=1 Tax=Acinetobacter baumannii TaxID=470 RepID=UPI00406C39A6
MAENIELFVERGIAELKKVLGSNTDESLLRPSPTKIGEAACFKLTLPIDYTGIERVLRIAFPVNFPRRQLKLSVEPSPWLVWPHSMKTSLCLHGFKERPITGSPETIVKDCIDRIRYIVSLCMMGSDEQTRLNEFQQEISSYWNLQLGVSPQNLILFDRPEKSIKLYALSDPRRLISSGFETIWLSSNKSIIQKHYARVLGRSAKTRALATPSYYLKLLSLPELYIPQNEDFLQWITPHVSQADSKEFLTWFDESKDLISKWVLLELPNSGGRIFCLNIRSPSLQEYRGPRFGLRSSRRHTFEKNVIPPQIILTSTINLLTKETMLSRDIDSNTNELGSKSVVLIGNGSLGGSVASQLARSGIGHLTLIDPDILVAENLGRHVLGADQLGALKATELRKKLIMEFPIIEVKAFNEYVETVLNQKPEIFEKADLVINTTADWECEARLWALKSEGSSWAYLQAWSEPYAYVGHALFAPRGAYDARIFFEDNGDFKYKLTDWPNDGIQPLPACGESFIPGGAIGIVNIASMVAQFALHSLTSQIKDCVWCSSINKPQDTSRLKGKYLGPELPKGAQQLILEREWPSG